MDPLMVPQGESNLGPLLPLGLLAEEVYRDRRRRGRYLPERLLGEPAWDMLLDLFAAETRGHTVSVSSACLAAEAPMSTGLRWLQHLEVDGLVERVPDPADARRHFVRLTTHGSERLTAYFTECRRDILEGKGWAAAAKTA